MAGGFFSPSAIVSDSPDATLPACGKCGLSELCKTPKMAVSGRGRRGILVVGESPSGEDDADGSQMVDMPGRYLRRELGKLGVDLDDDCWKTNALICPAGKTPPLEMVEHCRPNLRATLRELKPTTVILLGKAAVDSLVGWSWGESPGALERWTGWKIPDQKTNAWIHPTWSPAEILQEERNNKQKGETPQALWFRRHLAAAVDHERPPWKRPPDFESRVRTILDPDEAARVIRKIIRDFPDGIVAMDYETTTLKPDSSDARICACSVAWGRAGKLSGVIAYPWHGAARDATNELWRSPIKKVASNKKFEQRWTLKEFGHPGRNWVWDTMLDAHLLDNRPGITSIKFQAYVLLGQPLYNKAIEPFFKSPGSNSPNQIHQIRIEDLLQYCGMDSLLEFIVAHRQAKQMGVEL